MAVAIKEVVSIRERCRIAPRGDAPEQSLRLTCMDMPFLHIPPIPRLLFYRFPCSTSHFYDTIVRNLKNSLSDTLTHYSPVSGNLCFPVVSSDDDSSAAALPELQYVPGDSVAFVVAELLSSDNEMFDLDYLTGNNKARDSDVFYAFVPDDDLCTDNNETKSSDNNKNNFKAIASLLSVQVTLFPGHGICIGFTNHHALGDASSLVGFMRAWSTTNSRLLIGEGERKEDEDDLLSAPFYDRSVIKDPEERLANIYWNQLKNLPYRPPTRHLPTNKVRETFIMSKDDICSLRNLVSATKPGLTHLSSFTITTAYVWSCLAKAVGGDVKDEEPEYYVILVNMRIRQNPPIPAAYFGNCLAFAMTKTTHGELKSGDGFLIAVEAASKLITETVSNEEELQKDADDWFKIYPPVFTKRMFSVSGSPKFDFCDHADFGWGAPVKYEMLFTDGGRCVTLCKTRESEGGLEIGLSASINELEAFEAIFYGGLANI